MTPTLTRAHTPGEKADILLTLLLTSQVSVQERDPPSSVSSLGAQSPRSDLVSLRPSWPVVKQAYLSVSISAFIVKNAYACLYPLCRLEKKKEKEISDGEEISDIHSDVQFIHCEMETLNKSPAWKLLSPRPLFVLCILFLKHFLLSLQGRHSTCSCGSVISNWDPLL